MDRITSQLLAEVDGVASGGADGGAETTVFIMGATNRPDLARALLSASVPQC